MWKPESATLVEEEWKPKSAVLVEPERIGLSIPLDKKSPQFKEFALSKEGSGIVAAASPEVAARIAAKEQPSRNDLKELGITGWNAEERKQLATLFGEALADPQTQAIGIGLGPMWDEPGDTRTMRERLGAEPFDPGILEIGKSIREMVAPTTPYTEKESDMMAGEWVKTLENIGVNVLTLGGLAGPLMGLKPSELRAAIREDSEELAGFGPALTPAAGETALMAVEWGYLYPKLFAAVGTAGKQIAKIPKVAKGAKALKSLGGIEKVATKYPRTFNAATKGLAAFTKGATVGTIMAAPEALGEELPAGEVLKHIGKRAALLGGVSAGFQLASTADTAIYARRLRNALIRASNQRFTAKLAEVDAMPKGAAKSAANKSLSSLKKVELQQIDNIVSAAEAQLIGLKTGKMYQQGQELVETPQKAAERFIRQGIGAKAYKGEPLLKKGLGETKPFIEMPTTRAGEVRESVVEAAKAIRHPVEAARKAIAGRLPKVSVPTAPKAVTPPPTVPVPEPTEAVAAKKPAEVAEIPPIAAEAKPEPVAKPKKKGLKEKPPAKAEPEYRFIEEQKAKEKEFAREEAEPTKVEPSEDSYDIFATNLERKGAARTPGGIDYKIVQPDAIYKPNEYAVERVIAGERETIVGMRGEAFESKAQAMAWARSDAKQRDAEFKGAEQKALKEIKYEEEAITEPTPSPEMEPGKAGKIVPTGKPTGKLDPTNPEEALKLIEYHANWVVNQERNVWEGIFSQKEVEYTPEQIDTAYRTVQKPVESPMPDTELFALPDKETQMKAIAQKMAKVKGVVKPKKKGPKALTKPTALPKAKTKKEDHIKAVYVAAAKESERYAIVGVKVEGDILIATDGRRMLWAKGKWGKDGIYLDVAALKKGLLGKPTKETKEVYFPKWRDIVPDVSDQKPILVPSGGFYKDIDTILREDLETVFRRIRQAASITTEESRGITIIENKDGSLGFAAAAPEVGHVEINVNLGGRILGAVNPQFLMDVIKFHAIRGNPVFELYFKDWDRPILTKSLDGKTNTVTMPINVGEPSEAVKKAITEFPPVAEKPKSKGLKKPTKPEIKAEAEPEAKPKKKGVKEKPDVEEEGGGVDWVTAVRQALEKSKKKRRIVRIEQKKERRRRAGAYEGTVKWLVEEQGLSSKEALDKATAMLKGPLTEYELYQGLDEFLPPETIANAYDDIRTTDILRPYERKSTKDAFEKLEKGAVLTPYDVKMITKWRPEFAKIAEKRVPLTVRIFSNIEQALGMWKFGAGYDVQIRRNARWLRARHPELFTESVVKNLDTYMIEKHAVKLEREVEDDPRHEDAVAHRSKFLEKGERPEQYISAWPEKIPFGIGKAYAASLRGYRAAHNWLQQQLWNYKIEVWERSGDTITEEMLYDLADWNNTMLGQVQAKTKFGRALRRVLAPVMWSPTLTWSRIRSPSMILSNKTMRIETAVSLAGYIGSGIIFMLAASFLARALRKKDPIEWDPRATDFGKIRVGNTRIDVYGDGGPYIRAMAQLIYQKKKNQAGRLRRRPRLEVLKQFVRNKRAPFLDFIGKVWSGRTYYGGPAWEIPDWAKIKEEDGVKQLVARAGEKVTETKIGQKGYLITKEIAERFGPFFVQAAVEASWHDGWPLGLAAGTDEFFSGQALSYKPSTYAKVQMLQDISAVAKYDTLWDDLSPSKQKQLRKEVDEINVLEEQLAREKLPIEEIDLREQIKVAERIRRSLSKDIREELAPLGRRIIPGLSRRIGTEDYWLNDKNYAQYEKLATSHIEKRLKRLFAHKDWTGLDISQKEKTVRRIINEAKKKARAELLKLL